MGTNNHSILSKYSKGRDCLMLTDKDRKEIVKLRIENAHQTMKEAELMIDNEFWNAAINRMYYASSLEFNFYGFLPTSVRIVI